MFVTSFVFVFLLSLVVYVLFMINLILLILPNRRLQLVWISLLSGAFHGVEAARPFLYRMVI